MPSFLFQAKKKEHFDTKKSEMQHSSNLVVKLKLFSHQLKPWINVLDRTRNEKNFWQ